MRKYLRILHDKPVSPESGDSGQVIPRYKFDWVEDKAECETVLFEESGAIRAAIKTDHRINTELEEVPLSVARTLPEYYIYRDEL